MPDNYFDADVARTYEVDAADMFEAGLVQATVDFLAGLAGDGAALEFGVGTGRIALPLSQQGVRVAGIDLSPDMVATLRAKPGGSPLEIAIGDMATTKVANQFRVVYLVFNTIINLLTQAEQVDCFRNAAAHLEPGGCFVIEVGVPDLRHVSPENRFEAFTVTPTRLGFDEVTDFVNQRAYSHHYRVVEGRLFVASLPWRWVWPAELDLMAELAGLRLRERWADWDRSPFTGTSTKHISVWERPA